MTTYPLALGIEEASGEASPWPVARACRILSIAVVVLLAIYPFMGSGGHLFTDYDDDLNFKLNTNYHGLGLAQIRWAWGTTLLGVFQPVAWMLLELEYTIGGLRTWIYHLTSILLHAAVCVSLLFLTRRLITWKEQRRYQESPVASWVASALAVGLFAAHPLRTEVVAWISCQSYLPCALFGVLCVFCYLNAVQCETQGRSRVRWLAVSLLLLVASLLCHPLTVGLPLVLVILDWHPLGRFTAAQEQPGRLSARRVLEEKIPFMAAILPFIFMTFLTSGTHGTVSWAQAGVGARIAQAVTGTWFYLGKTIWPVDLSPFYLRPASLRLTSFTSLAAIAASVLVTLAALAWRSRVPAVLAAWAAYLVLLAPASGLVMFGSMIACDRYSYIATMPLAVVLLASGLLRLAELPNRAALFRGAVIFGLLAVIILTVRSGEQCAIWADPETLWQSAVERKAPIYQIYDALGVMYRQQGKTEESIWALCKSLEIHPDAPDTTMILAEMLARQGKQAEAIGLLDRALRLPVHDVRNSLVGHRLLADLFLEAGKFPKSAEHYRFLIRLDPWHADLHRKLASALDHQGLKVAAAREYRLADEIGTKQRLRLASGDEALPAPPMPH